MDASRAWTFVIGAIFLGVVMGAGPGHAKCDPSTDPDQTDVANARAAIAVNCDCAAATGHGAYVSCAVQQANLTLANKSCKGAVKRCAAHSTCGKPAGAVTCCVTQANGTKCKIKRDAAHCKAPNGGTACVGSATSCCDACGSTGCAVTSTTTTSPPTTITTTTTTSTCPVATAAYCGGADCGLGGMGSCAPEALCPQGMICTTTGMACGCTGPSIPCGDPRLSGLTCNFCKWGTCPLGMTCGGVPKTGACGYDCACQ